MMSSMEISPAKLKDVLYYIQPLDVVLFRDASLLSIGIQRGLGYPVGHAAIVRSIEDNDVVIYEVGRKVGTSSLSTCIHNYGRHQGQVYILRLSKVVREAIDVNAGIEFADAQLGKGYSFFQAFMSGLPWHTRKNHSRFHCSELVAATLEAAGAIPKTNSSEWTPHDIAVAKLYVSRVWSLVPELPAFNSIDPALLSEWDGVSDKQTSIRRWFD